MASGGGGGVGGGVVAAWVVAWWRWWSTCGLTEHGDHRDPLDVERVQEVVRRVRRPVPLLLQPPPPPPPPPPSRKTPLVSRHQGKFFSGETGGHWGPKLTRPNLGWAPLAMRASRSAMAVGKESTTRSMMLDLQQPEARIMIASWGGGNGGLKMEIGVRGKDAAGRTTTGGEGD